MEAIRAKEEKLTKHFLDHLSGLHGDVTVYGPEEARKRIALVSFNLRNITPSDAALYFEENWGIMCRPGLHCAPAAHRTIGTFPQGTVRFSFGFFHKEKDIDRAAEAVRQILKRSFFYKEKIFADDEKRIRKRCPFCICKPRFAGGKNNQGRKNSL